LVHALCTGISVRGELLGVEMAAIVNLDWIATGKEVHSDNGMAAEIL
jgi:hypothetical protein